MYVENSNKDSIVNWVVIMHNVGPRRLASITKDYGEDARG